MPHAARSHAQPHARSSATRPSMPDGAGLDQPPAGTIRPCLAHRGELARHRLISGDGHDCVVTTYESVPGSERYVTAAYPVQQGYLVLARQPLCELRSLDAAAAIALHEQLIAVLADAGVGLVRARRALARRQRAETQPAGERTALWEAVAAAEAALV